MAALHNALKTLGPLDFSEAPLDDLKPFLSDAFSNAQLIVDSVPLPAPSDNADEDGRSRASSSASSASEISLSSARSAPPPAEVEALQKEWKQVKLNASQNPLGMSVYKAGGKDGKGAWFARRSVHEGLGFTKWKKGLEREFPETMKVQGGPGEGNIRGIGGERRVAYKNVNGVGKLEVYLLSAQFPGPTTPRDFVTMFLTSDQALSDTYGKDQEIPRHFMVISRPCSHPDTPPRDGFIRGQYESVEFIREIPRKKPQQKSASAIDLPSQAKGRKRSGSQLSREAMLRNASKHPPPGYSTSQENLSTPESDISKQETRSRGKTISFDKSRGFDAKGESMDIPREDDEDEQNPVEWIMITRSDPGGSVPRFMIERGTPGGIVSDASKFLDWACALDLEELLLEDDDLEPHQRRSIEHNHEKDLHNYQTNGHLAGIEEATTPTSESAPPLPLPLPGHEPQPNGGGLYGMVVGVAGAAGGFIAAHTPAMVSEHFPSFHTEESNGTGTASRRESVSSTTTTSSAGSFTSALDRLSSEPFPSIDKELDADASSTRTTESSNASKAMEVKDKELQKLEERKRKLEEKLKRDREKEISKKSEDTAKEEEALRKAEERHEKEVKKQEEKYKKEVEKLEKKREKDERKAEERRRKALEKDERTRIMRELEEMKAEVSLLRKERDILRGQVGDLQAENTALAARVGRLGAQGEEVLKEVRADMGRGGRLRASSLKGMAGSPLMRSPSFKSSGAIVSGEKDKENTVLLKS